MSTFHVDGIDINGNLISVPINAENLEVARLIAKKNGLQVLSATNSDSNILKTKKSPTLDLELFSEELIALLSAGISLIEAIEIISERLDAPHKDQGILHDIINQMREGKSFSKSLEKFPKTFPDIYIASVAASEQTGEIVTSLTRYLRYHEQIKSLRQKIIHASLYPAMLLIVGFAVGVFLIGFLVPRFGQVYEGMESNLPFASKWLIKVGMFINNNSIPLSSVFLIALLICIMAFKTQHLRSILLSLIQKNRWLKEKISLLQFSRFSRSLAMLLDGGIPLVKAMRMACGVLPVQQKIAIINATQKIEQGVSLNQSLQQVEFTTRIAKRLIKVGEQNGQLSTMLDRIADFHDKEISLWIDKTTRLFEPILMLIIGVIIGGIVILLYLPIFDLAGGIE